MRNLLSILFTLFLTLCLFQVKAQSWPFAFPKPVCNTMTTNCTKWPVTNNGQWDQAATWNGGTVPGNNDIVCIPVGWTVKVKGGTYSAEAVGQCQVNPSASPRLYIFLCGTIDFDPSGKLYLGCGSFVQVYPGGTIVASNGSSDLIQIGPTVVWGGPGSGTQPNINGPYYLSGVGQGPGVLAVSLIDFTTELAKPFGIHLKWTTASEMNNKEFIIERSKDNVKWYEIGSIPSTGNHNSLVSYSFTDINPAIGFNFYRLKQTEQDGRYTYSKIIQRKYQSESKTTVFPNPVKNEAVLYMSADFKKGQAIQIYNINGGLVQTIAAPSGNSVILPLSKLAPGIYMVKVSENGKPITHATIVKQ